MDRLWNPHISAVSLKAWQALQALDESYIGTPHYMGLKWFHASHDLKRPLRNCTPRERAKIHDALIIAGLDLLGNKENEWQQYEAIVKKILIKKWESEALWW